VKTFITGATGVIGRKVVPRLIRAGHGVTAIGRSPESRRALEAAGARAVDVSLFDAAGLARAVAGHDTVVNLATHMPSSIWKMFLPGAWRENDRIRREGSANLVNAAIATHATRFIQESFAPIYADGADRWLDESWPAKPVSYNRSIVDAERSAERFTTAGGTGIVLRFAAFYGPDDFARAFVNAVKKGWSPLAGSPDAFFSSVAHDDAASAVLAALSARAGTYNVTDDEPLRRRDYVGTIADLVGVRSVKYTPRWVARLMGSLGELMSRSLRMSNEKLKRETGWKPSFPSAREGWREAFSALAPLARPAAGERLDREGAKRRRAL